MRIVKICLAPISTFSTTFRAYESHSERTMIPHANTQTLTQLGSALPCAQRILEHATGWWTGSGSACWARYGTLLFTLPVDLL